nr:hypothetical protein [Tanacetum cinerariifolium]
MSTQQDIYAAGFESRPHMLNKENYVPWSSRLLRYAKSRPNGKLIHNSILNGPYVRKMIHEPGDANREITVTETFHLQIDDELFDKELKHIEADDQAIQTILLGLPEDIYAAVDSCETAQEIWLRVQQMMKGFEIGIQEKKAKLFNEREMFTSNEGESIKSYYHHFLKLMNDLKRNKHFPKKIASNLKFLNNLQPEWNELKVERIAKNQDPLALMANSNNLYVFTAPHQDQSSFNQNYMQKPMPNSEDITDPTTGMNMALVIQNAVQNPRVQNVRNHNGLIGVQGNGNHNQIGNGNLVAARAEGNAAGQNRNQIRCYNCRGVGHYARNYTVRPRRRDAVYLQTQLLIAQKEKAGIQLQAEEYDLMAAAADLDEIEEVNANCILMANLQQASTSGTQTDSAPVYDTDGSAEVHKNCGDNEIFNMFTQDEQYTELLEPIPESHQVSQNDNDVISEDTSMEQGEETVEQHPANFKETCALYESLYKNLAIEVEKVNSVNRKLKETNADLTTELARYKNQERCFEISQEKYDKLERSTNVVNALREPFVVKQDHGVNPPHIDECCCECGDALDGIFCQRCTCKSCGKGAHIGYNCLPKVLIISNPEPCNQTMNNELPQTLPSFDPSCYSNKENSVPCVSKPNFIDESFNIFNPPPQPPIYSCEFCGSNAQYGHYSTPQVPFIYPEQGYSQDFNFPHNIHDFQQQYLCGDQCGGPHETFQCQQKQEEKRIEDEQAANAQYWKIPACCDDDDDYNSAVTPVLSTEEPDNSLSMGDEHLDTISATESDEVIKSSVEDLVPIPSESEGTPNTMCDVHLINNPTPLEAKDHFEIVIKSNDEISSSDDDSLYNKKIEYVEASPHDSEVVSLEVAEIVISEDEEIEDDNLRKKLL